MTRLVGRLREVRRIVLRELDALADGDGSTTEATLEEVERSLAAAIDEAGQVAHRLAKLGDLRRDLEGGL